MISLIPQAVPEVQYSSLLDITSCIVKGTIVNGPAITTLEQEFAIYHKRKFAIAVSSARYALYLIYSYILAKSTSDEIILPAYTCIPAIDAARWTGATIKFVDIDETYNAKLEKIDGGALMSTSYLYGLMGAIPRPTIPLIEDAAIALGGKYDGKLAGTFGHAAVVSLQSSKIITAWRGGIILTDDEQLNAHVRSVLTSAKGPSIMKLLFNVYFTYIRKLFSHPFLYKWTLHFLKRVGTSKYFRRFLSYMLHQNPTEAIDGDSPENLPLHDKERFTNVQAVMALASFRQLPSILQKRRRIAKEFSAAFPEWSAPTFSDREHAYGRFPVRIPGLMKNDAATYLIKYGIEIGLNYPYICPQTKYCRTFATGTYPIAETAAKETFILPMHTQLRDRDVQRIIKAVQKLNDNFINKTLS